MTDILMNEHNDVHIQEGQILLVAHKEVLVKQRLLNRLRTFSNTYWVDRNYGLNVNLFFVKGSKVLLDKHLQKVISDTEGIEELLSFESEVNPVTRIYTCKFSYKVETGAITSVKDMPIYGDSVSDATGIWREGIWHHEGIWDNEEIWGS